MQKKILVTGSAGFIGYHVSKKLLESNHDVCGIDNLCPYYDVKLKQDRIKQLKKYKRFSFKKLDLSSKATRKFLSHNNFHTIIHLAAQAGVRHSLTHPEDYVNANITGFLNILEGCKNNKPKHLLFASTSSVYGANQEKFFSENNNVDRPIQFYAVTKRANELMAHAYSSLYDISITGLRFFTVYGPWGRPDMALFKFTKNILANKPIEVFNNGEHVRDFTYIDDIVDGILLAANTLPKEDNDWLKNNNPSISNCKFSIYNIGANRPVHLVTFIKEIEKNLGKKAKIKYLPLQPGDVIRTRSSIKKLAKDTGYLPKTSVKEGVKQFINWYTEYYKV